MNKIYPNRLFFREKDYFMFSNYSLCCIILIRQAISNFSMEKKAGEMQEHVGIFKNQWFEYLSQMRKFQGTLDTLNKHFVKLVSTRKNQLEKPMEKILDLQLGQKKDDIIQ